MIISDTALSTRQIEWLRIPNDFFPLQSLKSRGIRFPGRDNESLAPIFTPPHSVSETEASNSVAPQTYDVPMGNFTAEQIKEAFDVARNSVELLSTVLSSSPHQEVLQVMYFDPLKN